MYLLNILRHDASSTCRAWVFEGCAVLRVSYSQRAVLRLWYFQRAAIRIWCSQRAPCAESMIVSAPPAESMILSAPFDHVITLYGNNMLTAVRWVAIKKSTISNTDNRWLPTLVNSASRAPPIGLPLKMAKFFHTSNRVLVGHWHRRALLRLYFNSSASSRSVGWLVGWSVHNENCYAITFGGDYSI